MDKEMFATEVMSYTHNRKNHVVVSKKYLKPGEHILIMDDFLANGCAVSGLLDLVKQADGIVEGIGDLHRKRLPGAAGDALREAG